MEIELRICLCLPMFLLGCVTPNPSSDLPTDHPEAQIVSEIDLPYEAPAGGDADMALMDVYYLADGQPKRLLLLVHGGSWVSGDKANFGQPEELLPWFLERGYVVAAPNFRLASRPGGPQTVTYRDQAEDLAHALDWLMDQRHKYEIADQSAVLLGYSSGAHLVALLAADPSYLAGAGRTHEDLGASISFDVHAYHVPYALNLMAGSDIEKNIPFIEHLFGATENEQLEGSPANHAGVNVPPTLLVSAEPSQREGSHGFIVNAASGSYAAQLDGLGVQATHIHFDEESHQSLVMDFGAASDGPTASVSDFLGNLP